MKNMPLLKQCCGPCADLRQGSFFIGLASLVCIGLVEVAVAIYCLFNIEEAKKRIKFRYPWPPTEGEDDSDTAAYIFFGLLLFVAIIYIIVCILLMHGVRYKRRFLLLPWILFTALNMIMAFVGGVLSLINSHGYAVPIIVGVITIFISCLWAYFVVVVVSFFQALHDGDYW